MPFISRVCTDFAHLLAAAVALRYHSHRNTRSTSSFGLFTVCLLVQQRTLSIDNGLGAELHIDKQQICHCDTQFCMIQAMNEHTCLII